MAETRRVALVTGGAQGIGRAIAERLARSGFSIVVADVQADGARRAAAELAAAGATALGLPLDVSDERAVAEGYAELDRRLGRLDILVNNAGIAGPRVAVEELSLSDWEKTLRVNLTGAFLMCRGAVPRMKRTRWGRIVNVASLVSRMSTGPQKAHYSASKAGIVGFSRTLAQEVGRDGITVNCVAPSRIPTALALSSGQAQNRGSEYLESAIAASALGRLGAPEDVAGAVAYLASEDAGFITGAIIDVNGGTWMP